MNNTTRSKTIIFQQK